ncbi:UDP-N-acetylglucosamine 4,6-dehydratase (inverting) [Candidatus Pelagibacter bacterium]|nr:UDP-N-acetylglucosamine 4,6-dehydratase (inverting) [Candidatus Pelagibacter bacterium]
MFKNKTLLITGGTGSFGKVALHHALRLNLKKIIIFSRDELKQYEMKQIYPQKNIRYFIGDVRDYDRVEYATKSVDYIIHAAALKQVDTAEYNPLEAIKTNITGAENIIKASINNSVSKVMALSTDKAANPINLYGATKLCSDKLFVAANNFKGRRKLSFSITRYGNVIGSRGSVVHLFHKQSKSNLFTVTHPQMTRFWISIEDGVSFAFKNLKRMIGGEIFIPKIPSIKILDLVKSFNQKPKIKYIGLRPGEKIHEILLPSDSSHHSVEFKDHYTILPDIYFSENNKKKFLRNNLNEIGFKIKENFEYNSENNKKFLKIDQLKKINQRILNQ